MVYQSVKISARSGILIPIIHLVRHILLTIITSSVRKGIRCRVGPMTCSHVYKVHRMDDSPSGSKKTGVDGIHLDSQDCPLVPAEGCAAMLTVGEPPDPMGELLVPE